jgi:hypothetical protein
MNTEENPDFNPDTPVGHPHAEFMAQYAEIARTNPKPWERFEHFSYGTWHKCVEGVFWSTETQYRITPVVSTCTLAGITFPKPVSEPLEKGQQFWLVSITHNTATSQRWDGYESDKTWLKANLIQLTEEGAKQQLLAMQTTLQQAVDSHA